MKNQIGTIFDDISKNRLKSYTIFEGPGQNRIRFHDKSWRFHDDFGGPQSKSYTISLQIVTISWWFWSSDVFGTVLERVWHDFGMLWEWFGDQHGRVLVAWCRLESRDFYAQTTETCWKDLGNCARSWKPCTYMKTIQIHETRANSRKHCKFMKTM